MIYHHAHKLILSRNYPEVSCQFFYFFILGIQTLIYFHGINMKLGNNKVHITIKHES